MRNTFSARAGLATVCLAAAFGTANAGPAADQMLQAENLAASGAPVDAVHAARAAMQALMQNLRMRMTTAVLVAQTAAGYGIYEPRESNVFHQGEPVLIYVEPFGYSTAEVRPGLFEIAMNVDLAILDSSGSVLGHIDDVTELSLQGLRPAIDFHANLTYTVNAPPGDYIMQTTLRDQNSTDYMSFNFPIVIIP
jgi:hypothetical protein